jgi:hypothetical protein
LIYLNLKNQKRKKKILKKISKNQELLKHKMLVDQMQQTIKTNVKEFIKPGTPGAPGTNNQGGGPKKEFVKGGAAGGGFNKGKKPIIQKVEPSEEDVKNQIKETLERLQGKGE